MTRYETLLEVEVDEWDGGRGVVQVVTPDESNETELRLCYYNADGQFTNRPLTLRPDAEVVERTSEMLSNLGFVARNLDPDEIRNLVDTVGEERVIELSQLIDTLGQARLADMLDDASE